MIDFPWMVHSFLPVTGLWVQETDGGSNNLFPSVQWLYYDILKITIKWANNNNKKNQQANPALCVLLKFHSKGC